MTRFGVRASLLLGVLSCGVVAVTAACSPQPTHPATPLDIALVPASGATPATIRVTGLSSADLESLQSAQRDDDSWHQLFAVRVAGGSLDQPAVAGRYVVTASSLDFIPRFGLDPGQTYDVTVEPARLPSPRATGSISAHVGLPGTARTPTTVVTRVTPTAREWPENQLRFYIEFSAPMSRTSGLDFVSLQDDQGHAVAAPFLPLDVEFWNPDRTRYTMFFDPGRVKRGILPNEQMGRAIRAGRTYTVVIDAAWPDANGTPLKAAYRQVVRVGQPDERPITLAEWRLTRPAAGTREPLTVAFPEPLDHGLLDRALGVAQLDGSPVPGQARVEAGETAWVFTPAQPWKPGAYNVVVLSILEDLAGNKIGRAFEADMFERVDDTTQPDRYLLKWGT